MFALEAAPAFNHEPTELNSVFCIWEVMDLEVGAGTDREKSLIIDLMVSCDRGPTDLDDVHIVARKTQLTVALRELLNHFPFRSSKMGAFGDFPPIVFFGCPASVDLMRVRFACTDRCDRGGANRWWRVLTSNPCSYNPGTLSYT